MKYFRTRLFGFSKPEVSDFIDGLEKEVDKLKERNYKQQDTIQELRNQLLTAHQRENLLGETMVEVRQLSKNLLFTTKETAEEEARIVLEEAAERLQRAEQVLEHISYLEKSFANYEEVLKAELREIFEDYLARTETLSLTESKAKRSEVVKELSQAQKEMSVTKTIVSFPKATGTIRGEDSVPTYAVEAAE